MPKFQAGAERPHLSFAATVPEAFGFLADRGFRLIELTDTLARFESERRVVLVFHGRGSYELGVEVGRQLEVDGVVREQVFALRDVIELSRDPAEVGYGGTAATSPELVVEFLGRLAGWTQEFAAPLLQDGDELFDRLSERNSARSDAYLQGVRADRLREVANAAWKRRDFAAVVDAYTEIAGLPTVGLRQSERGRLDYAAKALRE